MNRREQIDAMAEIIDRAFHAATGMYLAVDCSRKIALELDEAGYHRDTETTTSPSARATLSEDMIEAVLALDLGRRRFKNPAKVRDVCYMRLTCASYKTIGKCQGLSANRCREIVHRVENLYKVYVEKRSTK